MKNLKKQKMSPKYKRRKSDVESFICTSETEWDGQKRIVDWYYFDIRNWFVLNMKLML